MAWHRVEETAERKCKQGKNTESDTEKVGKRNRETELMGFVCGRGHVGSALGLGMVF